MCEVVLIVLLAGGANQYRWNGEPGLGTTIIDEGRGVQLTPEEWTGREEWQPASWEVEPDGYWLATSPAMDYAIYGGEWDGAPSEWYIDATEDHGYFEGDWGLGPGVPSPTTGALLFAVLPFFWQGLGVVFGVGAVLLMILFGWRFVTGRFSRVAGV